MQFYISYFQQLRNFDKTFIPIDTSIWAPKWLDPSNGKRQYVNEIGVIIGIKEESFLMTEAEIPEEMCSGKPCPYIDKWPHCQFLDAYWKHLQTIDFDGYLLPELNRIAEDVRKITHYEGEPKIVLMVHEKPNNQCSERAGLIRLFKEHGIELKEWTRELVGDIF
jgi:hypothetical protein